MPGKGRRNLPLLFRRWGGDFRPDGAPRGEIVAHCQQLARQKGQTGEPGSSEAIDVYSHWFEQAYRQRSQRRDYLRGLIEGKPISPANFRLAHLLLSGGVGNLVVTPNFDDFLSRALALFGKQAIVCDHPHTTDRIDPQSGDVQIVHVHGTYWFYDCCNLRGEIEDRVQPSPVSAQSMADLLQIVLHSRSPIVIGYAGWDGDVIMTALRRRLATPVPSNVYWFLFRRGDVERLPPWLRQDNKVRLVVPEETKAPGSTIGQPLEPAPLAEAREVTGAAAEGPLTVGDREAELRAVTVLDALVRAFEIKLPQLTTDPIGFFADQLRRSLIAEEGASGSSDIYAIGTVIDRVELARSWEAERQPEPLEASLEQVRDAIRRSDYRAAIAQAQAVSWDTARPEQLRELMDRLWTASLNLFDDSPEELAGYDLVAATGTRLLAIGGDDGLVRQRVAGALVNKGVCLGVLHRSDEAIAAYDEVVARFGDAAEPALRETVANALFSKGYDLGVLNRSDEALAAYDEVVARFGDAAEPALRETVAKALVNKGYRLGVLNRSEEALAAYDEVVARFGDAAEPALRETVANALFSKGYDLGVLDRSDEALAAYDEVVARFGDAAEPALRLHVAKALVGKGVRLDVLGRSEEAVAKALVNRGVLLMVQGNGEAARQSFLHALGTPTAAPSVAVQLDQVTALAGLERFDEARPRLADIVATESIDPRDAKGLLDDLLALASAPGTSPLMQAFVEWARDLLQPSGSGGTSS